MTRNSFYDIIRNLHAKVSDPTLIYNGAPEEYEDPADYYPRSTVIRAVRLG